MVPDLLRFIQAIKQEDTAGAGVFEHIKTFEQRELVAGDELGLVLSYQVGSVDGLWPKAQMGNGHRTRFFGVVDEVALCIILRLLANNLDRVFVGPHGSIRANAPEDE